MADDLDQSRAAYDRGAWDEAFEALRRASQAAPLVCDDLQRLGVAATSWATSSSSRAASIVSTVSWSIRANANEQRGQDSGSA
jgi:hypothetical protein